MRAAAIVGMMLWSAAAAAQFGGGGPSPDPRPAREAAPIDVTGFWVAIVNEDWRWRMLTPPKGDYTSIQPLNARGRAVADAWDPALDGSCKAYGAAGLMRMPLRLSLRWDGDDVLELVTDAGMQTRRLVFGTAGDEPAAATSSLQGRSSAAWEVPRGALGGPGLGTNARSGGGSGSLKVVTTGLAEGWLRRNGVPYSDETVLTEYFDRFAGPDGAEWLVVTTIVEDPVYLTGPYVTSSHFRQEPDDERWMRSECRSDV